MDRYDFERAIGNAINENAHSSVGNWLTLAQQTNAQHKKILYDRINKELFGGKEPWPGRLKLTKFDDSSFKKVFQYLNKKSKFMNLLFKQKIQGIGAGEIMLAYIVENLTVGGGSATVDLNLFDDNGSVFDECELKEAKLTGAGFLEGWQLGANHAKLSIKTIDDFKALYNEVKFSIPELDPKTDSGKELEDGFTSGEWGTAPNGKRFKHLSAIKEIPVGQDREFKLGPGPNGEITVKYNEVLLGNLSDSKTVDKIKSALNAKAKAKVKTFDQIHTELIKSMGGIKEKFLFISTKGPSGGKTIQKFHFKKNLPGTTDKLQLHSITLNKCKFRVKA